MSAFDSYLNSAPAAPASGTGSFDQYLGSGTGVPIDVGSPTDGMSTLDKLRAGAGMGMVKIGRAVGQAVGAGIDAVAPSPQLTLSDLITGNKPATLSERLGFPTQASINEANKLDASLANTGAGKVGSLVGQTAAVLPAALIPGANTYLGSTAIGAGLGALTTEGGLKDRTLGAVGGAAGGAVGKFAGDQIGSGINYLVNRRVQAGFDNAGRDAAAQAARSAGFVIPPADTNPTITNEVLNGLSGKIKTAQVASATNQPAVNDFARNALGVPGQPLDLPTLTAIRNQAGQAYNAVRGAGTITPGPEYSAALDAIQAPFKQAAAGFPNAAPSPVIGQIEALRSPQFDASSAVSMIQKLRGDADSAYAAGNKDLGKALKSGAGALENAIEDHLTALSGGDQPGAAAMLNDFRNARQLIAKTYSVQGALNPTTGDVSAQALAKQLAKGKPLSGDLRTIAEAAQAFPKAFQSLKETPKQFSPLDFMGGLMAATASGHPAAALLPIVRPAVRSGILSRAYQASAGVPNYTAGTIQGLLEDALLSPTLQRYLPAQTGLLGARAAQ